MSADEPEKKELDDAARSERAARDTAEAGKVLETRQIDEAVLEHLKDHPHVRVKDLAKKFSTLKTENLIEHLDRLVSEGILEPGNTSNAPTLKQYKPSTATKEILGIAPAPEPELPPEPQPSAVVENVSDKAKERQVKLLDFIGESSRSEKEVKDFLKTLNLPNKNARRDFLADLVAREMLAFEHGEYRKFTTPTKQEVSTPVQSVEVQEAPMVILDQKGLEEIKPTVEQVQEARSSMIQMMNKVEADRRAANKDERTGFYSNLRNFLQGVRAAEQAGLTLSGQGQEQKKFLADIDALEEKRLEDEDSFRRAVIGVSNELSRRVRSEERRLSQVSSPVAETEAAPTLDESNPVVEAGVKLSAEEIRARGKNLEQSRGEIYQMMTSIMHPTEDQRNELYTKLETFLRSTEELVNSGLLLSTAATQDKIRLTEILHEKKIFNPRRFQVALQRIDDEFFAQAPIVEKKEEAPVVDLVPEKIKETEPAAQEEVRDAAAGEGVPQASPVIAAEVIKSKELLQDPSILAARARMVSDILALLPANDPEQREQLAESLVYRLVREIVESHDNSGFIAGDQLKNLLPLLRAHLNNDQDLLDNLGPKLKTWRQLAQRLSSGMNEVNKAVYDAWVAEYPEQKSEFLDYEGNALFELTVAADQWITDLENNTSIDKGVRKLLIKVLEQAKRDALQRFEIWSEKKTGTEIEATGQLSTEGGVIDLKALDDQTLESLTDELLFDEVDDLDTAPAAGLSVPPATPPAPSASTLTPPVMPGSAPPSTPATLPATPKPPTPRKIPRPRPLEVRFKDGDFDLSMAEAFTNDVFYNFFKKFDAGRNPGTQFDATMPGHKQRYEKALEAYVLWREAIQVFKRQAGQRLEQDIGIKPAAEDLLILEDDLERLVISNTQHVRDLIDQFKLYEGLEEHEARKENELRDLGGAEQLQLQLDEIGRLRHEKKTRADSFIGALAIISKQRSDAARAWESKNRSWFDWPKGPKKEQFEEKSNRIIGQVGENTKRAGKSFFGSIMDRFRGAAAPGSFSSRLKGLLRGKEAVDLEQRLQRTYGMSVNEAAGAYPEMLKRERAFEAQTMAAIAEYEQIEKRYLEVKNRVELVQRVAQQKEQISTQFSQLRRRIFADTSVATTIARLTAGRSRDVIKGLLDPAMRTPGKIPAAVAKAEELLAGLRRAADFSFTEGRYAGVPELAPMIGEGELITDADSAITDIVEGRLQEAVIAFKKMDKKGIDFIRKTFLAYGKRGYELGEQVLSEAAQKARAASDDRRANIFQAMLFELRTLNI